MASIAKPDHYFVVVAVWDEETEKYRFVLDDDTLTARFADGHIWDGSEWGTATNDKVLSEFDFNLGLKLAQLIEAK